mgnify:CR=1 FL=1
MAGGDRGPLGEIRITGGNGLYQDANYGYIGTELDAIGEGPFYSFPEKFYDLAFQAKEQQPAASERRDYGIYGKQ